MKINFILQSEADPANIYVRFCEGRTFDIKVKTGIVINPKNWTSPKGVPGMPKTNTKDAEYKKQSYEVTEKLESLKSKITTAYNKVEDKTLINSNWLKELINPNQFIKIPQTLVEYFAYYEAAKKHELKTPSIIKLNVVKHLLERLETAKKSKFNLLDIGEDFKKTFISYCAAQGYAPNTTARNFKFIKTVCYHAEANGLEINPQLKYITMKNQKVEKIYLSLEDLGMIHKATFNEDHFNNAKDWLIISCETGQRVSDFLRFNKSMIRIENNKRLIEFTQKKTGKIMTIPLSKVVVDILKKRKGEFPDKMSDQRYNEHIKTVCEYAGITYKIKGSLINKETLRKESGVFEKYKLVASHIGRRSFASNNYGRIPTSLLISATGHTTEQMFLEYIGKTDTQKAMQLAEYF